jgi:hypothetical protein
MLHAQLNQQTISIICLVCIVIGLIYVYYPKRKKGNENRKRQEELIENLNILYYLMKKAEQNKSYRDSVLYDPLTMLCLRSLFKDYDDPYIQELIISSLYLRTLIGSYIKERPDINRFSDNILAIAHCLKRSYHFLSADICLPYIFMYYKEVESIEKAWYFLGFYHSYISDVTKQALDTIPYGNILNLVMQATTNTSPDSDNYAAFIERGKKETNNL